MQIDHLPSNASRQLFLVCLASRVMDGLGTYHAQSYIATPNDRPLKILESPGHERFITT